MRYRLIKRYRFLNPPAPPPGLAEGVGLEGAGLAEGAGLDGAGLAEAVGLALVGLDCG